MSISSATQRDSLLEDQMQEKTGSRFIPASNQSLYVTISHSFILSFQLRFLASQNTQFLFLVNSLQILIAITICVTLCDIFNFSAFQLHLIL